MNTINFNDIELLNLERDLNRKYKLLKKRADELEMLFNKLNLVSDFSDDEMIRDLAVIKANKLTIAVEEKKSNPKLLQKNIGNKIKKTKKIRISGKNSSQKKQKKKNTVMEKLSENEIIKPEIIFNQSQGTELKSKTKIVEIDSSNLVDTKSTEQFKVQEKPFSNTNSIKKVKNKKEVKSPHKIRLEQNKWRKFNWKNWAKILLVGQGEQMSFDEMFIEFNQKYLFTGEDFKIARKGLLDGLLKLVKSGEVIKYSVSNKSKKDTFGLKRWERFQ